LGTFYRKEVDRVMKLLRLGSLLMILFLTAPMVGDCCLTVRQVQPCHESKQDNDVTCSARLQAVPENKTAVTHSVTSQFYIAAYWSTAALTQTRRVIHVAVLAPSPSNDIYLRTGTLLI
jgi:hypothetical protein